MKDTGKFKRKFLFPACVVLTAILVFQGCSHKKVINNHEQSFVDYVILNRYAPKHGEVVTWWNMSPECYPGIRLSNWLDAPDMKEE